MASAGLANSSSTTQRSPLGRALTSRPSAAERASSAAASASARSGCTTRGRRRAARLALRVAHPSLVSRTTSAVSSVVRASAGPVSLHRRMARRGPRSAALLDSSSVSSGRAAGHEVGYGHPAAAQRLPTSSLVIPSLDHIRMRALSTALRSCGPCSRESRRAIPSAVHAHRRNGLEPGDRADAPAFAATSSYASRQRVGRSAENPLTRIDSATPRS